MRKPVAIASPEHYSQTSLFTPIVRANPPVIGDPNQILVGQQFKVPIGA